MVRLLSIVATLCALAGCARATLPYTPAEQPPGARISAAYVIIGDRLRIEIDSNGRWLEDARILRPDGTELRPQTIEHRAGASAAPPVGVGVGVGGGTWGRGGVSVGSGVSVGFPVGGATPEGTTYVYFPLEQAGPAPWRVQVKLVSIDRAIIVIGGPPGDTGR